MGKLTQERAIKVHKPFDRKAFWQDPEGSQQAPHLAPSCKPEFYLDLDNVSALWVDVMRAFANPEDRILELGSGTGRNLVAIKAAGFPNVAGVEISARTIAVGIANFPEYTNIPVINQPVEECIQDIEPADVIYTSGLLMHIPPEHEWVYAVIAEKALRVLAVVEGEISDCENAWPRNYQEIFEALGWRQVSMEHCDNYPPLAHSTIKRVFLRE